MPHAVARLRQQRQAISQRPFAARGALVKRCPRCRVAGKYCICRWQPQQCQGVGVCLLMHASEALKPSNTGWLIADVVEQTHAFVWSRTQVEPELIALLTSPKWQPVVVFPSSYAQAGQQVLTELSRADVPEAKQPLLVILDGTWQEARKMFRKSPYLHKLPLLSLQPEHFSRYQLRKASNAEHLCTAEVMVSCLQMLDLQDAATDLQQWFERFNRHYLVARMPLTKQQEAALLAEPL